LKLKIDRENDALYLRLDDNAIIDSEEVQPGIILDYDEKGNVIGIEVLKLSSRTNAEQLKTFLYET
jgi:uncharacterized protein YuzE